MIASEDDARRWLDSFPLYGAEPRQRMELLVPLLAEENERQNLVARSSLAHVWQRHIADSAQLVCAVPIGTSNWLDLGTGAGFPGLVIAILFPRMPVTLVEVRSRRATWLTAAIEALGLTNVTVHQGDIATLSPQKFATISARAFAPLDRLIALAARFSTGSTIWLLPKGRSARDELNALRGWRHTFHVEQSLTDPDAGIITGHLLGPEEQRG